MRISDWSSDVCSSDLETLVSRLLDRPIRPLFPEGFYNAINAIAQVLSYDGHNEPDILAMVAASAALTISGVPFMGPIGAARVGYLNGEYLLNPTDEQAIGRAHVCTPVTNAQLVC